MNTNANPDNFYRTYVDGLSMLLDIDSAITQKLLVWAISKAEFNTNEITFSGAQIHQCAEDLGCIKESVRYAIARLVKKSVFARTDKASYMINPKIMWKGDDANRYDRIKFFMGL